MDISRNEKVALFIDGANLFSMAKALEFDIDYRRLLSFFQKQGNLVRALYYTTVSEGDGPSPVRPLLDWLDYNGFTTIAKPVDSPYEHEGARRDRGNVYVEFTIDVMRLAPSIDHIIIFSGDREYAALVVALREAGKRVSVVSTVETQPPMVSDDLRRAADQFIDLADLEASISRSTVRSN